MKNNKDYVGAIFLIFLGTVFLLNTTGILEWNVWLNIIHYWPIFLILGGLRLILGRSTASTIIISILAFTAFFWVGMSAYLNSTTSHPFPRSFSRVFRYTTTQEAEDRSKEILIEKNEYPEVENVNYNFNLGISQFTISDGIDDYLYLDAKYTSMYGEPEIEEISKDSELAISMKEQSGSFSFPFFNFKSPNYDFVLGTELLSDITIDNGVGAGNIEFDTQHIRNLTINTGTGDMVLTLSIDSIPSDILKLNTGTGSLTVNLPSEVGYEIDYNVGVGELTLGEKKIGGIGQNAEGIKSDNYDTAEKIVTIEADIGVGELNIKFSN